MATTLIGVPVIKDLRKVYIEKGRRWSVFEHAILEALAKRDFTLDALERFSNLPGRVVIEIIIRLMRAGWVELTLSGEHTLFRATPYGRLNATKSELPPVTKIIPRHLSYAVELITGSVFRRSDLTLLNNEQWFRRTASIPALILAEPIEGKYVNVPLSTMADELLEDDEEIVRADPTDWRPSKLIALASVTGTAIEGLGGSISIGLRKAIEEATRRSARVTSYNKPAAVQNSLVQQQETRQAHSISFQGEDLITGGQNHRSVLQQTIRKAKFRLVIHSTFMNSNAIEALWPDLLAAAKREVVVDILWGQSSEKYGQNDTLLAANRLRTMAAHSGVKSRIRVQAASSRSHSKILFADCGQPENFQAVIGSCNWLASRFDSFEASIRLRDPSVLADVAFELVELGRPPDNNITAFSTEMLSLGRLLARVKPLASNTTARIVLGTEHGDILLRARDEAKQRILLLSHQLGYATGPNLAALRSAARLSSLDCQVFYGRFSKGIDAEQAAHQLLDFSQHNLKVVPIQRPKLHAKVLMWDSENIVVTSQNWLSSDPNEANMRQEIGVHLAGPGVARLFRDRFLAAKDFA